jgi:hypothetical protein
MTILDPTDYPEQHFTVYAVSNLGGFPQVIKVKYRTYDEATTSGHNTVEFLKESGATSIFVQVSNQDDKRIWSFTQNKESL